MLASQVSIQRGTSTTLDARLAAGEIAEQLGPEPLAGVLFFCSHRFDLTALSHALQQQFNCPLVGCTSAGEIGHQFQNDGIVAIGFSPAHYRLHSRLIHSLEGFDATAAQATIESLRAAVTGGNLDPERMCGICLLDGLSVAEESATANLHAALGGVALVGGSAGDGLDFRRTHVFADAAFHTGAGVLLLLETSLKLQPFKLQHFEPSDTDLVITEADPATRTVMEVNGCPAATEYAELLGLEFDDLTPGVFSRNPVMLQVGDDWYVRSIQTANEDGSLTFFCAIDEGLPLTLARGVGFLETLHDQVDRLTRQFSRVDGTLLFDCILRRLEIADTVGPRQVEQALRPLQPLGFSAYGEQFGALHVNQTLTGVVLGER